MAWAAAIPAAASLVGSMMQGNDASDASAEAAQIQADSAERQLGIQQEWATPDWNMFSGPYANVNQGYFNPYTQDYRFTDPGQGYNMGPGGGNVSAQSAFTPAPMASRADMLGQYRQENPGGRAADLSFFGNTDARGRRAQTPWTDNFEAWYNDQRSANMAANATGAANAGGGGGQRLDPNDPGYGKAMSVALTPEMEALKDQMFGLQGQSYDRLSSDDSYTKYRDEQLEILRGLSSGEEARQRDEAMTYLHNAGISLATPGATLYEGLMDSQGNADLKRQLSAVDLGQEERAYDMGVFSSGLDFHRGIQDMAYRPFSAELARATASRGSGNLDLSAFNRAGSAASQAAVTQGTQNAGIWGGLGDMASGLMGLFGGGAGNNSQVLPTSGNTAASQGWFGY